MSDALEAAGGLVEASLAARQLEGGRAGAGAAAADAVCRNCGAALTGRYCQECGQAAQLHRSLLHLGEEKLFHFDPKGWRTLALLAVRPGLLTRRYIDGQRRRYVSPLGLFLFTVFLMFFAASLTSGASSSGAGGDIVKVKVAVDGDLEKAQRAVERAQRQLDRAQARDGNVDDARETLVDARAEVASLKVAAAAMGRAASSVQAASAAAASGASAASAAGGDVAAGPPAVPAWAEALRDSPVNTGHPRLDAAVRHAADNPELAIYKLKNTAYKFSFMLVPISLPFLWLMFFWRRGVTMYDHAVFSLYSLSFMSLLLVVLLGLSKLHLGGVVPWLATFLPPLHMGAQLRGTYALGIWGTLWRTFALLIVAGITLTLFLLFIVYITMS